MLLHINSLKIWILIRWKLIGVGLAIGSPFVFLILAGCEWWGARVDFGHLWVMGSNWTVLISVACGCARWGSATCGLWVVRSSWVVEASVDCPMSIVGVRPRASKGACDEARREQSHRSSRACSTVDVRLSASKGAGKAARREQGHPAIAAVVCVFRVTGFQICVFAILAYIF